MELGARRQAAWSASRAATRSCSAAAARRPRRCAAAGVRLRGGARCDGRRGRPGLRGHPRDPPRRARRRSPSSPATRIPRSPTRRSTGMRSRASRARSCSTWASRTSPLIAERLIAAGRAPDEPAAVVARGTLPGQRDGDRHARRHRRRVAVAGIRPPAITLIGPVAGPARPARVARAAPAARAGGGGHAGARAGQRAGGPAPRPGRRGDSRRPPSASSRAPWLSPRSTAFALICLTSPNGVRLFFEALTRNGLDARALAGVKVAAIGPGTAAALRTAGIEADFVPERFVAEGLLEALEDEPLDGRRVLDRARRRGARRAARRAARARCRGRGARALRHGRRAAQSGPARELGARRPCDLHLELHRRLLPRRGRRRWAARVWCRSGR